jgi:hypothetical protein
VIENLPVAKPRNALEELRKLMIPSNTPEDSMVELVISISDDNIIIRDLSAFLEFIDHVYGRLTSESLRSYARREHGHLRISRVQHGSWQFIIETTLSYIKQTEVILIIWLVLRYLPRAVQTIASAYNEYQQGRLARENRKRIRIEMEEHDKLKNLPPIRKRELASLIDMLYVREAEKLPRAIRFSRKALLGVDVRVRNKRNSRTSKEDKEGS